MDLTDFNFIFFMTNYVTDNQSSVFYTSCKLECAFMTDYRGHHSFFYHPDTMACITLPDKIYSTQNLVSNDGFQYWISNVDLCAPCENGAASCSMMNGNFACACAPGYGGSTCSSDLCDSNPCSNADETCVGVPGGFECRCVNILDDNISVITSPNYPSVYSDGVTKCHLIIGRPGQNINLNLDTQYAIETSRKCNDPPATGAAVCKFDYLELHGVRYCGGIPPGPIILPTGDNTTVRFKTDGSNACIGFKLSITYKNVITSPNYPAIYPHGVTKSYHIIGRPGQNINLILDSQYAIETSQNCNDPLSTGATICQYDYLQLDGIRYCGGIPPGPIILPTGDNTIVKFKTDGSNACIGFKLNITYKNG